MIKHEEVKIEKLYITLKLNSELGFAKGPPSTRKPNPAFFATKFNTERTIIVSCVAKI